MSAEATMGTLGRQLAAWLAQTNIGLLELRGPGGIHLCLVNRAGHVEAAAPGHAPRADHAAQPVPAPMVGVVLHAHPQHDAPLAAPGQPVTAGQVIALIQVGALLLPVVAPCDGMVTQRHVPEGATVGWGTPLVDIVPARAG